MVLTIQDGVMSIIYLFVNPAFPDFIKIGRCSDLKQRLKSLSSNTSLPLPFECIFACNVEDSKRVEATLHRAFHDYRINPRREFFRLSPEPVIDLLRLILINEIEVTADFDKETEPADDAFKETLYSEFTFDQASVPLGAMITFTQMETLQACVISRNEVEFEGVAYTLVEVTKLALIRSQKEPKIKISPARYWSYSEQTLTHRKHQKLHGRIDE